MGCGASAVIDDDSSSDDERDVKKPEAQPPPKLDRVVSFKADIDDADDDDRTERRAAADDLLDTEAAMKDLVAETRIKMLRQPPSDLARDDEHMQVEELSVGVEFSDGRFDGKTVSDANRLADEAAGHIQNIVDVKEGKLPQTWRTVEVTATAAAGEPEGRKERKGKKEKKKKGKRDDADDATGDDDDVSTDAKESKKERKKRLKREAEEAAAEEDEGERCDGRHHQHGIQPEREVEVRRLGRRRLFYRR